MYRTKKKTWVMAMVIALFIFLLNIFLPIAATPKLNTSRKTIVTNQSYTLTVKNARKSVKWYSSDKKIATVTKKGKNKAIVKAKKPGKVTITAKVGGKKLRCKVTVKSTYLNKKKVTLSQGKSTTLEMVNGKNVTWSSSNSSVAKISKKTSKTAKVIAVKAGKATITAKSRGRKYTCVVTVKKSSTTSDNQTPSNKKCRLEIVGGGIYDFSGTTKTVDIQDFAKSDSPAYFPCTRNMRGSCKDDSKKITKWSTSDSSIISIQRVNDYDAKITYKKIGKAKIYAEHNGETYTWTINVTDSNNKYNTKRDQVYKQVGITSDMKDQYKCFLIAKWMCENITYKKGSTQGQTYEEAFDEGTAVCGGYAHTYKYFMDGLGIPCEYVESDPNSGWYHAWNQVQIDGKWYTVDVTRIDRTIDGEVTYTMDSFLVSDNILNLKTYNPHVSDTRFDICVYKQECNYSWGHTGKYPDCNISLEEHKTVPAFTWDKLKIYSPWANGEWVNY